MKIANFITLSTLVAMLAPTTAYAQQLPNGDFEGEWVTCTPFSSSTKKIEIGQNPESWCISHVTGVAALNGTGKKELGGKSEGHNSSSAVQLLSNETGALSITRNVPAYITLGTTWNTSKGMGTDTDGGSFGGIDFTYTPDALQFYYTRKSSAPSTVLAFSWTGHWTQADVPAEIALGTPKKIEMTDRDRNIIGYTLDGCQGGTVTHTDDAALVSLINTSITEDAAEWTEFFHEFTYMDGAPAVPAKLNVVICSGDYFSSSVAKDDNLVIDDVKLVYYSRLKSLSVNGTAIALEEGKYNYPVDFEMPEGETVACEVLGKSATAKVDYYPAVNKATVTVTNVDADRDGEKSHVYTIEFANAVGGDIKSYDGLLDINMNGSPLANEQDATIKIIPTSDNTCQFLLPDFTLEGLGSLGDILVKTVSMTTDANGVTTYVGEEKGLQLIIMEIMPIVADVKINGTIDANNNIDMDIDVIWHGDDGDIPIAVKFYTKKTSGIDLVGADADAAPEYYTIGGLRVANPAPGTIYIVRRGNKVTKEIIR